MKLSIVIPCYNEAESIPELLKEYSKAITNNIELIIVNNNSTDNTENVLEEMLKKYNFFRYINEPKQGYGQAILSGLSSAQGEFIGWAHGDLQVPPSETLKAMDIINAKEADNIYIKGKRKGRPIFDSFFTVGMSFLESVYLGKLLWDINAQPNFFHRSFLKDWTTPPTDFSLDLYSYYTAKKRGMNIKRFKINFPKRKHGESSWNNGLSSKLKFIKRTLIFSRKLKKRLKNQKI